MTDHFMIRQFIIGCSLLLLGGCDGGIFGTGDGEDPTIIVPGDTTEDGQMGAPVNGDMNEMPGNVSLSFVTANGTGSFNNSEITSSRSDAQIKLINASPDETLSLVAVNNNMVETPLLPLPGLTQTTRDSGYIALSTPANAIALFTATDVTDEDFTNPVASFDPITLAAGSTTSLIVRGIRGNTSTPLELFAVGNQTEAINEQALIRAFHAATLTNTNIDIILKPEASVDQQEVIIGIGFDYQSGITEYASPQAGTYNLIVRETENSERLLAEPETIVLLPNEVITLILLDSSGTGDPDITVLRSRDSGL